MIIRAGYDIAFDCPSPTSVLLQLNVHPSRAFDVLFQQDSANEPEDGRFVGEDTHDIRSALDLSIETLDGIVGVDLRPVGFREGGVTSRVFWNWSSGS